MLSPQTLRELLTYNPETGELKWLPRGPEHSGRNCGWKSFNRRFAGKAAFTSINRDGYHHGRIFDGTYQAHRVAWAIVHGSWPEHQIDHINGDRADNRLSNLRAVSGAENCRNIARPSNNSSGHIGVVWHKKQSKWQAQIGVNGKRIYLGLFASLSAAVEARAEASRRFGFHENHGRAA